MATDFASLNLDSQAFGFGVGDSNDVMLLNKSLSAGYNYDEPGVTGGAALRVQSLESSLKTLTYTEKHMVFWKKITKLPAYSTVEEYSQLVGQGSNNLGFVAEGTLPNMDDVQLARQVGLVKFLGTTRRVTHPMTLVQTIGGDALAVETRSGILKIMRDAEYGLFFGNSSLFQSPNTTGVEWDGLQSLIPASNIVDLGNTNIEQQNLYTATEMIYSNFGFANQLFMSPAVASILTESGIANQRTFIPTANSEIALGYKVNKVITQFGELEADSSVFMSTGRTAKRTPPAASTNPGLTPDTPLSITAGTVGGTGGQFRSSQVGSFVFQVTACNYNGESAPSPVSASVAITSSNLTNVIPLTITNPASITNPPIWFNIYASAPNGTQTYYVGSVNAASVAPSGTTTYNYNGFIMANTSEAYVGELSPDVLAFKQLAPIMKMDLAVIDPSFRFMILLYGVMQLYAPLKWVRLVNIKDY